MKYYSLNRNSPEVSFREAVIQGLAPDKGLYFPKSITPLPPSFFENMEALPDVEIAFEAIRQFVGGDIPDDELRRILSETLSFGFPIVEIESDVFSLELFHGPTMAFKDVGARFMARCLGFFNKENPFAKNTVLVATSGDTGGAVASGFLDVSGVNVVILYPNGHVSEIQERQLTTMGANIRALRVDGTFDDCQEMVKKAFLDDRFAHLKLTSANSINIARWLPQLFYFLFAYKQLKKMGKSIVVSCPSGNFGNICAGLLARRLGLPIAHFVAATNANDTVPRFLERGQYDPEPSVATLSNAMDVGNPSNFIRILELYRDGIEAFRNDFSSYSFSDAQTSSAMKLVFDKSHYVIEPHAAVAYLGLQKALERYPGTTGVFLGTAHPIKFLESVQDILNIELAIPDSISGIMNRRKVFTSIESYAQLENFLLDGQ